MQIGVAPVAEFGGDGERLRLQFFCGLPYRADVVLQHYGCHEPLCESNISCVWMGR